jgi:hypothetical protein
MNVRAITVFLWGSLIATAAVAGEDYRAEIRIAIEGDEPQVFEWHSDDPDADLSTLELGESRTLEGADGGEVTVTRTDGGLEFNVDGRTIEMPHDGHHAAANTSTKVKVIRTDRTDGVTIISSDELDAGTRAKIEAALEEAGKDGEVIFLDGSEPSGAEQVHREHEVIIRKEIKKTTN